MGSKKKHSAEREENTKQEEKTDSNNTEAASAAEAPEAPSGEKSQPERGQEQSASSQEDTQKLQSQVQDLHSRYMRAKADQENYRKRMQREMSEARTDAKFRTVSEFLTVYDHFKMAMDHANEDTDFQTLKQGMDMIYAEFSKAFENLGLEEIDAEGEPFDPALHEALGHETSDEMAEGHVLRQWQKGYRIDGRLIRPARVIVSAGKPEESDSETSQDENAASQQGE